MRTGLLALLLGVAGGGCLGVDNWDTWNPIWCANDLCAWTVDGGKAEPVASWHERDPGLLLSSNGGRISILLQTEEERRNDDFCIVLEVAVGRGRVRFELDASDDGTAEFGATFGFKDFPWMPQTIESRIIVPRTVTTWRLTYVNDFPDEVAFYPLRTGAGPCWAGGR